jgi:hypothetical protein
MFINKIKLRIFLLLVFLVTLFDLEFKQRYLSESIKPISLNVNKQKGLQIELDSSIGRDVEKYYTFSFTIHQTLSKQLNYFYKNPNNFTFEDLFSKTK